MHKVHRYHDICAGHRVVGHESKCRHLHGHNYRVHFTCVTDMSKQSKELGASKPLDDIGRVIDFSVVKERLCMWLEENWDHRFLMWEDDPWCAVLGAELCSLSNQTACGDAGIEDSIVEVPFNPTAENMAQYLVDVIGPQQLAGTGVKLIEVLIEETAKCHASYGV